jgi:hypothetical protein
MAEALRAIASVLEKLQGGEKGQGSGFQEGRAAVLDIGSLGLRLSPHRWRLRQRPSEPLGRS